MRGAPGFLGRNVRALVAGASVYLAPRECGEVVGKNKSGAVSRIARAPRPRISGTEIALRIIRGQVFWRRRLDLPLPRPLSALRGTEYPLLCERVIAPVGSFTVMGQWEPPEGLDSAAGSDESFQRCGDFLRLESKRTGGAFVGHEPLVIDYVKTIGPSRVGYPRRVLKIIDDGRKFNL